MLASMTQFMNVQDVPVVIVGSFFIIFWWIITVSVNHVINPEQGWLISLAILLPCVVVSLLLTKFAVTPFAKGLKNYDEFQDARERLIGSITTVTTSEVTPEFGSSRTRDRRTGDHDERPNLVGHKTGEGRRRKNHRL